jgi:8-oxo-dGTP diphosphatase
MYSVVVNGVILNDTGKVLIAQRANKDDHEPGMWTTPGGTLEAIGEEFGVLEDTLKREIMEEVGVEIMDEVMLITNNTFIKSSGKKVLAVVYLCKYKSGEPKPLDEIDAVTWVTKDDLSKYNFPPNVKEYITLGFEKSAH